MSSPPLMSPSPVHTRVGSTSPGPAPGMMGAQAQYPAQAGPPPDEGKMSISIDFGLSTLFTFFYPTLIEFSGRDNILGRGTTLLRIPIWHTFTHLCTHRHTAHPA